MDLSVVIPVYNEEANLPLMYNRLNAVMTDMGITNYEYIFVNDGSVDASLSWLLEHAEKDEHVKYINFSRNFGHQIAVYAGADKSKGKAVVFIDGDLQDPPELIKELYTKFNTGYDVVYAKRRERKGESKFKLLTAKWFYKIIARISSVEIPLNTGDFRIISNRVVHYLRQMPEQEKFLRGQISWIGFKQSFVEYDRDERNAGETGYTFKKMFSFAMDGITSFSTFPLKVATAAGFVVSFIALVVIIYALYSYYFLERTVTGWTSLIISVLFLGGVQLLTIGVIGEYIGRINNNVKNRPVYIIQDTNIKE